MIIEKREKVYYNLDSVIATSITNAYNQVHVYFNYPIECPEQYH